MSELDTTDSLQAQGGPIEDLPTLQERWKLVEQEDSKAAKAFKARKAMQDDKHALPLTEEQKRLVEDYWD